MEPAIAWRDGGIAAIDQTALPHEFRMLRITTVDQLVDAITRLAIRGAPVLGAAGALGVALAVRQSAAEGWDSDRLGGEIARIAGAPAGTRAFNFAFDITPAELVTAIITEERTIIPNER